MSEWQPIDTAPKSPLDGEHIILVGWDDSTQICRAMWNQDEWVGLLPGSDNRFIGKAITLRDPPTRWMPIPR